MIQILLEKIFEDKKKEHYNSETDTKYSVWDYFTFGNLFWIVCVVSAVFLSWTCEENKQKYNIGLRIFFAFIAAFFNFFYILAYLIFMQGTCKSPKGVSDSTTSLRSSTRSSNR
jgi:hypothetical protein